MAIGDSLVKATEATLAGEYDSKGDYDGSGNLIYYGRAAIGSATSSAVWAIRKLTYDVSGNLLTIQWANGNANYVNVWDNRASYSYS
jgi:YD repeat-containing protein